MDHFACALLRSPQRERPAADTFESLSDAANPWAPPAPPRSCVAQRFGGNSLSAPLPPFDKLKISFGFRRAIENGARDSAATVHTVVNLGRGFGMKVTVEGGRPRAVMLLRAAGVHSMLGFGFGFGFGRPVRRPTSAPA